MADFLACEGCGKTRPEPLDVPVTLQCRDCPPWHCERCDRTVDMDEHLKCGTCIQWFKGMPLADIKAAFADLDLSVAVRPEEGP